MKLKNWNQNSIFYSLLNKNLLFPNPILRFVKSMHLIKLINKLTLINLLIINLLNNFGYGINSNQLCIPCNILILNIYNKLFFRKLIIVISASKKNIYIKKYPILISSIEGCLSIKNFYKLTIRFNWNIFLYRNICNKLCIIKLSDYISICFLHEIDHSNGKLINDKN